jgi:hypothetical protein
MSQNPHEELARHQKAQKLADVLNEAGLSARQAGMLSQDLWMLVASVAGTSAASMETKLLVIEMMRARETVRSLIAGYRLNLRIGA